MSFANFAIEAGVNSAKPAEPAGSDTAKPTPASGPASVPSVQPGSAPAPAPTSDADGLDFDFGDTDSDLDTDDGTGGDDDGGAPAEIVPLGPPEGATKEQAAEWRAQHGIPHDPTGYQAPKVDGITWNTQALAPILEAMHAHNIPREAVADALQTYAEQVQQQQADLKRQDRERMAEVRQKLTPSERGAIDAASQTMSRELRTSIRQARLPSGELLLHSAEFLSLLANLNRQPGATNRVAMAQNDAALEETARLHMRTDIEKYYREKWDQKLAAILNRKGTE